MSLVLWLSFFTRIAPLGTSWFVTSRPALCSADSASLLVRKSPTQQSVPLSGKCLIKCSCVFHQRLDVLCTEWLSRHTAFLIILSAALEPNVALILIQRSLVIAKTCQVARPGMTDSEPYTQQVCNLGKQSCFSLMCFSFCIKKTNKNIALKKVTVLWEIHLGAGLFDELKC